jgi:hypothetical protein
MKKQNQEPCYLCKGEKWIQDVEGAYDPYTETDDRTVVTVKCPNCNVEEEEDNLNQE